MFIRAEIDSYVGTLRDSMGPHTALLFEDVLREVLGHLRPSGEEYIHTLERIYASERRLDLAMATRVCRAFQELAIATLWRVLPDLKAAWTLFASFTLIRNEDAEENSHFYYVRLRFPTNLRMSPSRT